MKISNNTLAVLLVTAILLSIFGTLISVSYINNLSWSNIVGMATTDTGNVTLTVTSAASCIATDELIAFGSLARTSTNQSESANNDFITVENDGNTNLNITVNATEELWADGSYWASAYWRVRCNNAQSGTCSDSYTNLPNATPASLVVNMVPDDGTDELDVASNVTVPSDETAGAKNGMLTFYCTAS